MEPLAASRTAAGEGRWLRRSARASRLEVNRRSAPGATEGAGGGGGSEVGSFELLAVGSFELLAEEEAAEDGGGGGGGGREG